MTDTHTQVKEALELINLHQSTIAEGVIQWHELRMQHGAMRRWEQDTMIYELRDFIHTGTLTYESEQFIISHIDSDNDAIWAVVPLLFFEDRDAAIAELKAEVAEAKAAHERAQREAEQARNAHFKANRRRQYLELKKEFGDE